MTVAALVAATVFGLPACASRSRTAPPAVPAPVTGAAPRAAAPLGHSIIPLPGSVEFPSDERFVITEATRILVPAGDEQAARVGRYLSDLIGIVAGPAAPPVERRAGEAASGTISLELAPRPSLGPEGYELSVSPDRVVIVAHAPAGLFYGVQTFRQLLPAAVEYEAARADKARPIWAPVVRIVDRPRFAWRGAMLDVARHFFGVEDVERFIDLMVLYKLNRLHLHLSDDQGWRIEIKAWPNLTAHGATTEVGGTPGGFFTQDDYARLVAYAAERFVTVVPEIDMPGHTNAALASYAELNCDGVARSLYTGIEVGFSALCVDSETTYRFIDDVVGEIGALTKGPYFHMGGDEVKTLTPAQYAQFVERVQGIVRSHGKVMLGWDEVSGTALAPDSIVQVWRPDASPASAVARGTKVVLSPAARVYLDMKYDANTVIGLDWAGLVSLRQAYDWDPGSFSAEIPESAIHGVEAPLWTETLATIDDLEYMLLPRLTAVAEVAWSAAGSRRWDDFRARLAGHGPRLTALGANFYRVPDIAWPPNP